MFELNLHVRTTHGEAEVFKLDEMWDYYHENIDHFTSGQQDISFGDYVSGEVWNWAASGSPAPMLIDGWLDHKDLAEFVDIHKLGERSAFAEISSILEWIDADVDETKPFGQGQILAFLTYVNDNGWEFINFDEIDNFMEDTYCGAFSSAWQYVEDELIGNRFIADIPSWLRDAVDEDAAIDTLKEDGLMEVYEGRSQVFIFRQ